MSYVPVLILSNWSIQKIYDFLEDYLNACKSDILAYKIEKYRTHRGEFRDSNRTILIIKKSIYDLAMKEKLDIQQPRLDFILLEYKPDGNLYPYEGYSSNLFIKINPNISVKEIENLIDNSLALFIKAGFIKPDSYTLSIPLHSRVTGEHRGFAICNFNDSVDVQKRILIKSFLHNINIIDINKNVQVFWARKRKLN